MVIVAIHQPHYFPWIGYFDKLAKSDCFILLDEVQFEKGSQMIRNRVLDQHGEIKYLTIMAEIKGFLNKKYRNLRTKENVVWKTRQIDALENYYRKTRHKDEILEIFRGFLESDYSTVCEWTCGSIRLMSRLLGIKTKLILQSEISYDRESKKSNLVLSLCEAVKADTYLSGRGASVGYLDRKAFQDRGIAIDFQDFMHPIYKQTSSDKFVSGLSVLDMLFNVGVNEARDIFWRNVCAKNDCSCLR